MNKVPATGCRKMPFLGRRLDPPASDQKLRFWYKKRNFDGSSLANAQRRGSSNSAKPQGSMKRRGGYCSTRSAILCGTSRCISSPPQADAPRNSHFK
jgi:hypothetical protein